MSKTYEALMTVDKALVKKGFAGLSPWWRDTLRAFYTSQKKQLVLRVGRRGGKSSSLCRVAVAEAIGGEHQIPKGDIGVVAFVSVSRREASERLRTIKAILDALGLEYRPIEDGVELVSKPIAFRVFPASVGGVSGFTSIAVIADEVAKWKSEESGMNPASEVLAAIRPTMATQPNARLFLSSSALTKEDAHAKAYDAGETEFQSTAFAETWVAHPAITEAATHTLEPDPKLWAREYACIPSNGTSNALEADDIAAMVRPLRQHVEVGRPVVLIDSSRGNDGFSYAVVRWVEEDGERRISLDRLYCFEKGFAKSFTFDQIVEHIAKVARAVKAKQVFGDQYLSYSLESAFAKHGLVFREFIWSMTTKIEATNVLRRLMRERTLVVEPGEQATKMQRETGRMTETITASGALTIQSPRTASGHGDRAALLLLLAHAFTTSDLLASTSTHTMLGEARFKPIVSKWQGGFDAATPIPKEEHPVFANPKVSRPVVTHGGAMKHSLRGRWTVS